MPEPGQRELDSRIGALALREGRISAAELLAALKYQRELSARCEYRPLGAILVETGKLAPEELERLLGEQTESWGGRRMLGHYRLLEKIGEGGMGAVWKAVHVDLGNTVAIKLLPRAVVGDLALVDRFQQEARLMATVNHTNVVQAFDAGEDDGQPYFVMPFLDGASLGQVLRKCGRLGVRTTLSIALQIVRGLRYAHERGMVHRDLKPDNLFLTRDGTVKILDLGLAKLMEGGPGDRKSTQAGLTVGTPQYMAPEQIMGHPPLDGRADIYSLGATLFQLLSGQAPFPGRNAPDVVRQKLDHPPPDPQATCPDLPLGVRKLLLAMLARQPSDRPSGCEALEAEIEALLDGKPITGTNLAPEQVVLGLSERASRTFSLATPGSASSKGKTAISHPRQIGSQDTTATMVLPRSIRPPPAPDPTTQAQRPADAQQMPCAPPAGGPEGASAGAAGPARMAAQEESPSAANALPRVEAGWVGQLVAAVILVIVTIVGTLAVVKMLEGERRSAPPKTEAPR